MSYSTQIDLTMSTLRCNCYGFLYIILKSQQVVDIYKVVWTGPILPNPFFKILFLRMGKLTKAWDTCSSSHAINLNLWPTLPFGKLGFSWNVLTLGISAKNGYSRWNAEKETRWKLRAYTSRHNTTSKKPRINFLSKIIQQAFILSTALQNI